MSNLLEHLKEKNSATLSITSNEMISFVHFFLSYGEENRNGERKNEQSRHSDQKKGVAIRQHPFFVLLKEGFERVGSRLLFTNNVFRGS